MASSKEYLDFMLDQLSGLDEISYRTMMGVENRDFLRDLLEAMYEELPAVKKKK